MLDHLQLILIENYERILLAWYCNLDYNVKESSFQAAKYVAGSHRSHTYDAFHRVMASSYSPNRRYSDLVSEISFFPFYLFICRLFLFYQRLSFSSVSVSGLSPASTGSGVLSSVRRTTARENKAYPYSQSVNRLPPGYTVHMANQALLCKYGKGC